MLRSCLGIDCQWTALKPGTEFLRPEDTKEELVKLFKGAKKGGADDEEMAVEEDDDENGQAAVPESIRSMYDKPIAMSALGGMIW
jgi:DNA mismatch repair protein MSH6